ncbi:MAG: Spy/CpxP family protein refolding chaperone [Gemmatimonadetes bacterium]|nr:Spy/CpxP family protein refolding chaperone [Gemmatimonadota bacterium]
MRRTHLMATAALLVVAAIPVSAQRRTPGAPPADTGAVARGPRMPGGMGPGMMGGGMMGPGMMMRGPMGGPPAAMLARMKTPLGLSDEQVKRLETLAAQQRTALEPNVGAMLRARADLADARKGEGDLAATRRALEKMAALRIDGTIAHLKAMQETRAVLTAEQREKLVAFRGAMRGRMRGMRGGPGGPMGMHGPGGPMGGHGGAEWHGRGPGGMGPAMGGRPGDGPEGDDAFDFDDELMDELVGMPEPAR